MDPVIVSGAGYIEIGILSYIFSFNFEVNFLDHSYRSVQIFHTHIPVQIHCARIFLLPPPQPKKISQIKKMWPMYPKKWCHSPELNKIRSFLSVSQLLHCTNTVRLSNNSLITNYRNSFH